MSRKKSSLTFKEVATVSRPLLWVYTAAGFVASYGILSGHHNLTLYVGAVYFALAYNLMMYGVNDIYDYDGDIKNPRKIAAGLDGSVMSKTKHPALWWWIVLSSLPFVVYLYTQGSMVTNVWLSLMLVALFTYSLKGVRFKEIPILDSINSSFHYTSPFIYGGLLAGATEVYWPAFAAYFLWGMGNHAFGAIQDITPDRQGGLKSVATQLGATRTVLFVAGLYIAAGVVPIVFYGWHLWFTSVLVTPYLVIVGLTWPYRHDDTAPAFRQGWKRFLYTNYAVGFVVTIALLMV